MCRSKVRSQVCSSEQARRPTKLSAIALANKLARTAWAMMARNERYKEPAALACPAMLTSCSDWRRLASTSWLLTCQTPTGSRLASRAMVAEEERRMISKRTKDALAAAKRRGTKLGGDRGVVPSKKARAMGVEALRARADAKAADLAG